MENITRIICSLAAMAAASGTAQAQQRLQPVEPVKRVIVSPDEAEEPRRLANPDLVVEGMFYPDRIGGRGCIAGAYFPAAREPEFAAFKINKFDGELLGHFTLYEEGVGFAPSGYGLDEKNFTIVTSYDALPPIAGILVQYYLAGAPIKFSGKLVESARREGPTYLVKHIDSDFSYGECPRSGGAMQDTNE